MRLVTSGALAAIAVGVLIGPVGGQTLPTDGDPCGILEWEETNDANARMLACAARGIPDAEAALAMVYWGASAPPTTRPDDRGLPSRLDRETLELEGHRLMAAAAEGGSAAAQNELGLAALNGEYGLSTDFALARYWLERADAGGDAMAPLNLARLYYLGLGVVQSDAETQRNLRVAATRGNRDAICSLAALLLRQDPPDMGEVVRLRQIAREIGGPCGEYDLMPELRR